MKKNKKAKRKERIKDGDYINNQEFFLEIKGWKEKGGRMSDNLGKYFIKLIERYSQKPNFSKYTFLEDMKNNALYQCILYAHNFDPKKSQNPFSYFTNIIHNAFIQTIKKEKEFNNLKFNLRKEIDENISRYDYRYILKDEERS